MSNRERELIEKLNAYHTSPKIRCGAGYIAAPMAEPTPEPEVPNQVVLGMQQSALAYWELSKIYKNIGTEL